PSAERDDGSPRDPDPDEWFLASRPQHLWAGRAGFPPPGYPDRAAPAEPWSLALPVGLSLEQVPDLDQQLVVARRLFLLRDSAARLDPRLDLVERNHDQEVDDRSGQHECHRAVDHRAEVQHRLRVTFDELHREPDIAAAAERVDQRIDDAVGEDRHQVDEGSTDDHRDREFDDVPSHQELFEPLEHDQHSLTAPTNGSSVPGRPRTLWPAP